MTREDLDFIGAMNMCDEISNEAYKKIMCHCDEQEPCENAISRQAVLEMAYDMSAIDGEHFTEPYMVVDAEDIQKLPPVNPQPKTVLYSGDGYADGYMVYDMAESKLSMSTKMGIKIGDCRSAQIVVRN